MRLALKVRKFGSCYYLHLPIYVAKFLNLEEKDVVEMELVSVLRNGERTSMKSNEAKFVAQVIRKNRGGNSYSYYITIPIDIARALGVQGGELAEVKLRIYRVETGINESTSNQQEQA